jgi:pyruvate-formate lyase-activating enzyme
MLGCDFHCSYCQNWVTSQALWVSWPNASSKVDTDLKEGVVRDIGLANGLVEVKVVAIDETWSGLKFVHRLKDRP